MHETNSRGRTEVYMPRDRQSATHKLGELSAVAAKREWDRAALIALLVKPGKPGRKRTNVRPSGQEPYTINEFVRLGVYGFRSKDAVRAYLKAWELSGLPTPEWGGKVEMPCTEFPDVSELYTVNLDRGIEPEPKPLDEADSHANDSEDDEMDDDTQDEPSPNPRPSPPHADPIQGFLRVLDKMDPSVVVAGQDPGNVTLLIKTMTSWLESLREAAAEIGIE
jgi:hypothetical protein